MAELPRRRLVSDDSPSNTPHLIRAAEEIENFLLAIKERNKYTRLTEFCKRIFGRGSAYLIAIPDDVKAKLISSRRGDITNGLMYIAEFNGAAVFWKLICAVVACQFTELFNFIVKMRWNVININHHINSEINLEQLQAMTIRISPQAAIADRNKRLALIVAFEQYGTEPLNRHPESGVFVELTLAMQFLLQGNYDVKIVSGPSCHNLHVHLDNFKNAAKGFRPDSIIVLVTGIGFNVTRQDFVVNCCPNTCRFNAKNFLRALVDDALTGAVKLVIMNTLRNYPERPPMEQGNLEDDDNIGLLLNNLGAAAFVCTAPPGQVLRETTTGGIVLRELFRNLANPERRSAKQIIRAIAGGEDEMLDEFCMFSPLFTDLTRLPL